MSVIQVANLTFSYEGSYDEIFKDASFQLDTSWRLGFTGRNGRGKTTFLNLLMGKYAYSGRIYADVQFEYFPYEVADRSRMTYEIMEEVCSECEDWERMRELSLLEVNEEVLYRPYETLSNGEQTKVLLAALFLGSNRFLLIDEPTNHLDLDARRAVADYLKKKRGFILVSHDRQLLDTCVDHILSINKTNIEIQKGNFSSWWENKRMQDQFELAENEKLQKEIGRLSAAARRSAGWSDRVESSKFGSDHSGSKVDRGFIGHKSAKMMKRAKTIEDRQKTAIAEKSKLLHNIEDCEELLLMPLKYHKEVLAEAKDLALFYDSTDRPCKAPMTLENGAEEGRTAAEKERGTGLAASGKRKAAGGISLTIRQGDRIGLKGKNGCGKSTLLKRICGERIEYTGTLSVGSGLKISYVAQDASGLKGSLSDYAREYGIDESVFKALLRKLGFERIQFEKNMEDFSGGQKKKVLLARSLCEQAHLYVWDEPLNYMDIFSRMQIEALILKYQPTLIFVEHDLSFFERVATKVVELSGQE